MSHRPRFTLRIVRLVGRVARDRRGATAIEYGLIAGLIVITMIVAFINLANTTTGLWNNISNSVAAAH